MNRTIERFIVAEQAIQAAKDRSSAKRKRLRDEINTCKAYLLEQFCARNISCAQVGELSETMYLRVHHEKVGVRAFSPDDLISWLHALPYDAESATTPLQVVEERSVPTETKPVLKISDNRERGVCDSLLPEELRPLAQALVKNRAELRSLAAAERAECESHANVKQECTDAIVAFITQKDPVHKVQRISVPEDGRSRTYILRCVETTRQAPVRYKQVKQFATCLLSDLKLCDIEDKARMRHLAADIRSHFEQHAAVKRSVTLQLQRGPLS